MRYLITAACMALVTLAACGGETKAPAATSEETDRDTARAKLLQCLREQGVDHPAQTLSEREQRQLEEALDGPCEEHTQDAFGGTDPRQDPEFQDAMTRFRACMRDEGLEFEVGEVDRTDPKVQEAVQACRDELPDNLRGGGR